MATEKTLNTRVKLRYDTHENWVKTDPVLLAGEIALASVSVKQNGVVETVPSTLIKCGDGTHKYSELDYTFARAADVIAAAKSEAALTAFINNVIADAGIATDEALAALSGRVTAAEGDIDALEALVGDTAVATQISNAVDAAKTELKGSGSDVAASTTIAGAKKYADSLNTAMGTRVDALESAIGEGGSVAGQITAEIEKLDKDDTAVAGKYVSAVSEENGIITVTREDLPDYTDTYAAKTHTHTIANVTGLQTELNKVTTLVGSDTGKSVRTIANEELVAQLIPESAKESLDTIQEIAAWIQAHPDDASAMNGKIAALENLVGDTAVATQISEAIAALKIGDYAKAADLAAAVARITTLEGKSHEHSNKTLLDSYKQTEANLADAVSKKHDHTNKTVLDGITSAKVTAWDGAVQTVTVGTGLKATKTGTDVALDIDDTVTFIFDCGNVSV